MGLNQEGSFLLVDPTSPSDVERERERERRKELNRQGAMKREKELWK